MKNLKRVLSLALAGTMLSGMMVMGASAADFTDAEEIQHTDAVNFAVALNIINGNPDGSFDPDRVVSRAEMAKMITIALNGGEEPVLGTQDSVSYTDIKGHWAEKYIEYCTNLGIISGRGDGTFDPEGTVTGTEAAKMLLVAMGYNTDIRQYTGIDWATSVNIDANNAKPNKLYDGLEKIDPSQGMTRDGAAQLIFNAVQDYMMVRSDSITIQDGKVQYSYTRADGVNTAKIQTILTEKYRYSVEYGFLADVTYNEDDETFEYEIVNNDTFGASEIPAKKDGVDSSVSLTYGEDISKLFGQQVKAIYNEDDEALGIYAANSSVLTTAVVGKDLQLKPTAESVKISGTTYRFSVKDDDADKTYKTADKVPVFEVLDGVSTKNLDDLKTTTDEKVKGYAAKLIDNDGDGRVNCVVITPITVAKVTFVGKSSITAGNTTYKFDDCDIYEDVAKNDWVVITDADYTANDTTTVVKAEIINGEIEATREVGKEVKMGGTWYTDVPTGKSGDDYVVDEEYNLVVVNGYVYHAEAVTSAVDVSDTVLVTAADDPSTEGTKAGTQSVNLLFADGSKKTAVTVVAVDDKDITDTNKAEENTLYTYSVDGNDYELTSIDGEDFDSNGPELESSDSYGIHIEKGKATVNDENPTRFADDAVIFVIAKDKTKTVFDVVSGKIVSSWKTPYTTEQNTTSLLYADKDDGFMYARLGLLDLSNVDTGVPGAGGEKTYGWITAKPQVVKHDGNWYVQLTVWNGEETATYLTEKTGSKIEIDKDKNKDEFQKGTPIYFEDVGDGTITGVGSMKQWKGAVTGYTEGKDYIVLDDLKEYELDKDTVVLYVNTADNEGVEGGNITTAQETSTEGVYVKNVYYLINKDGKTVDALVVDTTNCLSTNESKNTIDANASKYTVDEDEGEITTKEGTTVGDLKADATATIVVRGEKDGEKDQVKEASDALVDGDKVIVIAENGTENSYDVIK